MLILILNPCLNPNSKQNTGPNFNHNPLPNTKPYVNPNHFPKPNPNTKP